MRDLKVADRMFVLRRPEPTDIEALYQYRNDPEITCLLKGFSSGYSRADLLDWVERHRAAEDEVLWVVADRETDRCLGHVGLYQIDHRVRQAEFGILLGERACWGTGLGGACTRTMIAHGFAELNLNRIWLAVLADNLRAERLYRSIGFREEGRLRQAQYKSGRRLDVILMAVLRDEFADEGA